MTTTIYFKNRHIHPKSYKNHFPILNETKTYIIIRNKDTNVNLDTWPLDMIESVKWDMTNDK